MSGAERSGAESSGGDRGRRKRKGLTCGPSSSAGTRCAGCGVDAAWERCAAGMRDRAVSQREGYAGEPGALAWARASGLGRWRAIRGERGEWPCGARGRWASAGEGTGHGPDWAVSPGSAWEWAERDEREGWANLG